MSWLESVRNYEADIIRHISKIAQEKGETDILDHNPELLTSQTFDQHSTSSIRKLLGVPVTSARVLCFSVFKQLRPITTLPPKELWKAYWEVVKTHYRLWQWGIRHGDISVSNLMHNNGNGVLIDYDLAHIVNPSRSQTSRGYDRTGTVPFMSLDLLTDEAWSVRVERLYRHDLESFCWVLLWICACYDADHEQQIPAKYQQWNTNYRTCRDSKSGFTVDDLKITPYYILIFSPVITTFGFWKDFHARKYKAVAAARALDFLPVEADRKETHPGDFDPFAETRSSVEEGFGLLLDLLKELKTLLDTRNAYKAISDALPFDLFHGLATS